MSTGYPVPVVFSPWDPLRAWSSCSTPNAARCGWLSWSPSGTSDGNRTTQKMPWTRCLGPLWRITGKRLYWVYRQYWVYHQKYPTISYHILLSHYIPFIHIIVKLIPTYDCISNDLPIDHWCFHMANSDKFPEANSPFLAYYCFSFTQVNV